MFDGFCLLGQVLYTSVLHRDCERCPLELCLRNESVEKSHKDNVKVVTATA